MIGFFASGFIFAPDADDGDDHFFAPASPLGHLLADDVPSLPACTTLLPVVIPINIIKTTHPHLQHFLLKFILPSLPFF
jgi:hypothetical protein